MQRRLLDSREESSRNAAITEAKLRLTTLLASNGLQIWPVSADGDCLLSAVIAQVPELNLDSTALRQCLCEHITANIEHYSPFLQGGSCALLTQIERLKKRGQWNSDLGDLVPFAIANFLQRIILIFSSEETSPITPISPTLTEVQGKDLAIARLAVPGFEHYDAIKELPSTTQPMPTFCSSNTIQSPRHQAKYTSPRKRETVRKRERDEGSWKKNVRKRLRLSGKEYIDSKGSIQSSKKVLSVDCCKCRFRCQQKYSDIERHQIFCYYYEIKSFERKQEFLCSLVSEDNVCRSITQKKTVSRKYFLELANKRERVCQTFFLKTLNVSHKSVSGALQRKRNGRLFTSKDQRGRHSPHNKTPQQKIQCISDHINSFPTLDAHYTRKDTNRKFLEQHLNIRQMHSMYIKSHPEDQHVSEKVYRDIFNTKFNLSFHVPKKDQCLICTQFDQKTKTMSSQTEDELTLKYNEHQHSKKAARAEKNMDKARAQTDPTFESATFDLQAILSTPCGLVSQLYYKRKLSSYNLSFYTQSNKQGICYLWNETDGSKGSSEVGTCLSFFLNSLRLPITSVSLFSDTCGGQNKNKSVCAALLHCVNQHKSLTTIDQKFFEPGHSCMECDSMHSAIETAKKKTKIHVPSQCDTVIRLARKNKAYLVNPLRYSDFEDFKSFGDIMFSANKLDKTGKKVKFRNIVWFRYEKAHPDTVFFKYSMEDSVFNSFSKNKQTRKASVIHVKKKYNKKIPISSAKKKDLIDLCKSGVIPEEFWPFYERLETDQNITDRLQEADVVEESDDD